MISVLYDSLVQIHPLLALFVIYMLLTIPIFILPGKNTMKFLMLIVAYFAVGTSFFSIVIFDFAISLILAIVVALVLYDILLR